MEGLSGTEQEKASQVLPEAKTGPHFRESLSNEYPKPTNSGQIRPERE